MSRRIVAAVVLAATLAGVTGVVLWRRGPRTGPRLPQEPLTRPRVFVTDIDRSEELHDKATSAVKSTLVKGLREGDWALAASGLTDDFSGHFPAPDAGTIVPDHELGLRTYAPQGLPALGKDAFLAVLRSHCSAWSHIERTTWRTFEFLLDPSEKSAYVRLHFQLAGPVPAGGRSDLQMVLEGRLAVDGERWKVRELRMVEGCLVSNPRPPFRDITDAMGFHFNESEENRKNAQEIINARAIKTAGGLSCMDWNRDGFPDLLATMANRQAVLFLNDGAGGFVRAELPVKKPEEAGYTFLYVDLDNDGQEELVSTQILGYEGTTARLAMYTRRNGEWVPVPDALKFQVKSGVRALMVQSLSPCDVDGNGYLDLFVGVYSNSESGHEKFNAITATDGADSLLFMNAGGLKFSEESDERGITGTRYVLASQFFDLDLDGHTDLFQCNDFGPNFVWLNDGAGHFREAKGHRLGTDPAYTMGVTIADWDNTGEWSVYVSNMYSHAGNRIVPLATGISGSMKDIGLVLSHGNQMFEHDSKTGEWKETSTQRGVAWADWAWACDFMDFDNDGDKDLFVTNGYTSNTSKDAPDW
ncbi:MAG: VCBS repeat-containing protein [Planctomycetes bacterium]|nr:VCBS repeat-containing protein [Planctomycetota bacterium]